MNKTKHKKVTKKGQAALEVLLIFGVLVIGVIIFGALYFGSIREKITGSSGSKQDNNKTSDIESSFDKSIIYDGVDQTNMATGGGTSAGGSGGNGGTGGGGTGGDDDGTGGGGDGDPVPFCGDGTCNSDLGETGFNCSEDCGVGFFTCGNGDCDGDAGETIDSCPSDCSVNQCNFDLECDAGETIDSCPSDCSQIDICVSGFNEDIEKFVICNADDLEVIRTVLSGEYILGADINLSGVDFIPIGESGVERFTGFFDGDNHRITNLTIDTPENSDVGLFSAIEDATIKNLFLEDIKISGNMFVGGLVGQIVEYSLIDNVHVTGIVSGGKSGVAIGGLIGAGYGNISRSSSSCQVTGADWIGGLIGTFNNGPYLTSIISKSYATGDVNGIHTVGGLVGYLTSGNIYNSYATGSVTGDNATAGLIGIMGNSTVINTYSTGLVIGLNMAGHTYGGGKNLIASTNNFWDTESSNQQNSVIGLGKTTSQMKQKITFNNWDFVNVWDINSTINNGYPYLRTDSEEIVPSSLSFISKWDTNYDGSGSSENNQIILPLISSGNYDFIVDWGDGTTSHVTSGELFENNGVYSGQGVHTYSVPGVYTVTITGTIDGFQFYNRDLKYTLDALKIEEISQWGSLILGQNGDFSNASNLIITATDILDTSEITDMSYMFSGCWSLTDIPRINEWDTSNVTAMSNMFEEASSFNQPLNFDTSNVTYMDNMFYSASSFNQPLDFNTSNVINMDAMFAGASSFNQPLNFDTSKVSSMFALFRNATDFNQPLDFNTSNVMNMSAMFVGASNFNQPLDFNTSKVIDMSSMFQLAYAFNQDISNWDTSKVTNMAFMFWATSFNQNISNWNVSKVTSWTNIFEYCPIQTNYKPLKFR
ncbi:MAG: BspA family leucine-rich repeat surface protein [archaeon]|jgi:surface protein